MASLDYINGGGGTVSELAYLDGLRMGKTRCPGFVGGGSIGDMLQYRLEYHWVFEFTLTL